VPRPPKPRRVGFLPPVTFFNPAGASIEETGEIKLNLDEWEALRLKDYLGLDQQECAGYMELAQSTFQRILATARTKLASAVVEGKPVRIQGGDCRFIGYWFCQACGHEWETFVDPEMKRHRLCPLCGAEQADPRSLGRRWGLPKAGPGRRRRRGKG